MNLSDKLAVGGASNQAEADERTKKVAIIAEHKPRPDVSHHIVDSSYRNTNDAGLSEISGVNKRAGLEHSDQNSWWSYEGCDSFLSNTACTTRAKGSAPLELTLQSRSLALRTIHCFLCCDDVRCPDVLCRSQGTMAESSLDVTLRYPLLARSDLACTRPSHRPKRRQQ
jgi:hypothetical protein